MLGKCSSAEFHRALEPFLDEGSTWSCCLSAGKPDLACALLFPQVCGHFSLAEQRWRL